MSIDKTLIRRLGLGVLAAALLLAFGLVVARSGPLAPTRVTVAKAEEGEIAPALFGIGTVEARRAYLIGPTAPGRVLRVLVDVGEAVKAGQLLAEMDPVDLDQRLGSVEASLARAGSAVAAAEAQQRDARARHELAALNARRYADLAERQFVSPSVAEARVQEQTSAQAALHAADAGLTGARQDITRLRAEREALGRQRANVRLLAPADGLITARDAESGSTVVAGQGVVRMVEPGSLWVRVRLDQSRAAGLALGLAAEVALRSRPEAPLAGKVVRIEPLADPVTEERIAQVALDAPPAGLSVGELAEVTLRLPATGRTLVLPNAAIRRQDGRSGVWLAGDGEPRFVPVRTGQTSLDGRVQVMEGLQAGDTVVVHSEKALAPGVRVKVVETLAGKAP